MEYRNIEDKRNREELESKYGRMAVPTIIIKNRVILGFAENKALIAKLL